MTENLNDPITELRQHILDMLEANEEVSFAKLSDIPGFAGDKDLRAPGFANLVLGHSGTDHGSGGTRGQTTVPNTPATPP